MPHDRPRDLGGVDGQGPPEVDSLLSAAGQLFATGSDLDWSAAFTGLSARRIPLPTYAFVRRRFWLSSDSVGSANIASLGLTEAEHALLGAVVDRPDSGGVVLTGRLSTAAQPWLGDHAVAGTVLFPGRASWSWRCGRVTRSAAR